MQSGVALGIEDGHGYTANTGSNTSDKGYDGEYLFPSRILDTVPIGGISDMMSREDRSSIGNGGNGAASDEQRLEAIGTDIGYES